MGLLLLLILLLLLLGGVPAYRSGALVLNEALGVIIVIIFVLLLLGLVGPVFIPLHHAWYW